MRLENLGSENMELANLAFGELGIGAVGQWKSLSFFPFFHLNPSFWFLEGVGEHGVWGCVSEMKKTRTNNIILDNNISLNIYSLLYSIISFFFLKCNLYTLILYILQKHTWYVIFFISFCNDLMLVEIWHD
jgi:hypothetical protein